MYHGFLPVNIDSDMTNWTRQKEDELCGLWSERPCLYDIQSIEYSNRVLKESTYKEIADILQVSGRY